MRAALAIAAAGLLAAGCATSYQLTVMPRDSGKLYSGTAEDLGGGEGPISITIEDRTYTGTWVQTVPAYSTGYVTGGLGWGGRRGAFGLGSTIFMDNPHGGEAKALLRAPDGSGLRCDLRSGHGRGAGACRDDRGREYDVQIRSIERRNP